MLLSYEKKKATLQASPFSAGFVTKTHEFGDHERHSVWRGRGEKPCNCKHTISKFLTFQNKKWQQKTTNQPTNSTQPNPTQPKDSTQKSTASVSSGTRCQNPINLLSQDDVSVTGPEPGSSEWVLFVTFQGWKHDLYVGNQSVTWKKLDKNHWRIILPNKLTAKNPRKSMVGREEKSFWVLAYSQRHTYVYTVYIFQVFGLWLPIKW